MACIESPKQQLAEVVGSLEQEGFLDVHFRLSQGVKKELTYHKFLGYGTALYQNEWERVKVTCSRRCAVALNRLKLEFEVIQDKLEHICQLERKIVTVELQLA